MSQRLSTRSRKSAFHAAQIIGLAPDGTLIHQFSGSDPEGESQEGQDDNEGEDGGDDDDPDDGEDELDAIKDERDRKIAKLARENKKRRIEAREAKRRADDLQAAADAAAAEAGSGDKSEVERMKAELQKEKDERAVLETNLKRNLVETAILRDQKYVWHDSESVYAALAHEDIDIDLQTRSIDGLEDELDRIAGEKPFLVKSIIKKSTKTTGGNSKTGENKKAGNGSSGNNPGSGNPGGGAARLTREELAKKYKALR